MPRADATDRSSSSGEVGLAVPAYRCEVFAAQGDVWTEWARALDRLPAISVEEKRAYQEIFAAEGGARVDPRGGAASGLVAATVDDLICRRRLMGVAVGTPPAKLSLDERAQAYRAYFDEILAVIGGSGKLAHMPSPEAAAAFADTLFRHGRRGGARLIQKAIDALLPGTLPLDGRLNAATFDAFCRITSHPLRRQSLLDQLAEARLADTGGRERRRCDHFRFRSSSDQPRET